MRFHMETQIKPQDARTTTCKPDFLLPDSKLAQFYTGDSLIVLTAAEMTAAYILDAIRDLDVARTAYIARLKTVCGCCDTLCEAGPIQTTEKEKLQHIPENLLNDLRAHGLCVRQLAQHLIANDIVYRA